MRESYVIIANNNNKLTSYITLIDKTGHALLMADSDKMTKNSIQIWTINIEVVYEHPSIKDNVEEMLIEINGKSYTVSSNDYKEKKADGSYLTNTILFDCNVVKSLVLK